MTLTLQQRADAFAAAFPQYAGAGAALTVAGGRLTGLWFMGNDYRNKSRMYGAYPPGFLPRVFALFPDARRVLHLFSGSLTAEQVDEAWTKVYPSSVRHADAAGLPVASMQEAQRAGGVSLGSCRFVEGVGYMATPPLQLRFDSGTHPAAREARPDVVGDAEHLAEVLSWAKEDHEGALPRRDFDLVVADPPYAIGDQRRYAREAGLYPLCRHCGRAKADHVVELGGFLVCPFPLASRQWKRAKFKPLNKRRVLDECAKIVRPGGHSPMSARKLEKESRQRSQTVIPLPP